MMARRIVRTARFAAAVAAIAVAPAAARAQAACVPGPLSAYLASAGMGCNLGNLKFSQFAQSNMPSLADQIWVTPFQLAGPPGYTWYGFSLTFMSPALPPGGGASVFSFLSEGAPLYGLYLRGGNDPTAVFNTNSLLTGDGGAFSAGELAVNNGSSITRTLKACHVGISCLNGVSQWIASVPLTDADGIYSVATRSRWEELGPGDYTVAVLAQDVALAPEPATLTLLATGVGAIGAAARRRRRRVETA
ncbi:MAG: PEP-CTERM sorting domain-containing protein [Gemmatimonadota bacterium]